MRLTTDRVVKFGKFFVPVAQAQAQHSLPLAFGKIIPHSQNCIPVQQIFGRLTSSFTAVNAPCSLLRRCPSAVFSPLVQISDPALMTEKSALLECSRCLAPGHSAQACTSPVRRSACFSYGHLAKKCLNLRRKNRNGFKKILSLSLALPLPA